RPQHPRRLPPCLLHRLPRRRDHREPRAERAPGSGQALLPPRRPRLEALEARVAGVHRARARPPERHAQQGGLRRQLHRSRLHAPDHRPADDPEPRARGRLLISASIEANERRMLMHNPTMRFIALFMFSLVGTAGCGTHGELGTGSFTYACVDKSDVDCFSIGIPALMAKGSRGRVSFRDSNGSAFPVTPAAPRIASVVNGNIVFHEAGTVALI